MQVDIIKNIEMNNWSSRLYSNTLIVKSVLALSSK